MRVSSLKTSLFLVVMTGACGGGGASPGDSQPPIRTGGQLESIPANYHDLSPSISADGTKVVFVSGRDTTDAGPQLRIYRADWPAGKKPGKVERVTSEDLGLEETAVLSPDGTSVATLVSKDGAFDVYVVPYAGGTMQKISTDGGVKKRLQFSDDGNLLAWVRIEDRAVTGFVAEASGGEPRPLDLKNVEDIFWVPTGVDGSYTLGVRVASESASQSILKTATFSAVAETSSATFSDLGSAFHSSDRHTQASADLVMASRRVAPAEELKIQYIGDFPVGKPEDIFKTDVEDLPILMSTSDGAVTKFAETPGDASKSFHAVSNGIHFLTRNSIRCEGTKIIDFAWSIASVQTDGASLERRYPRLNASGKWEVTTEVCGEGHIDPFISDFQVAAADSVSEFRAVYVTRFSPFKDKQCRLKAGDPEIRLMQTGSNAAVYGLSNNTDPSLADSSRGDKGPCP